MKKIGYCIFFFAIIPVSIFAQAGYIVKDSTMSIGIKLIDNGDNINSRLCQVKENDKVIKYSPYQVDEYGFKDGRVFFAKDIKMQDSIERVFLERLYKGKTNLFFYKSKGIKTFYIEKDSTLFIEIPKYDKDDISYHKQLMNITNDCSNVSDATKFVRYDKKSLTKFIKRYNDCESKPFPHFRYGPVVGYELTKLILSSNSDNDYINYLDYKYDGGFSIGLFIDNPILVSDFSIHVELSYSKHGFSYNKLVDNIDDIDFVANISSLKLPILVRYTYPSNKFRPFLNIGGVVASNIKNENVLYKTIKSGNIFEINEFSESSLINSIQAGFSIGGGFEHKLNVRNSFFLELRYTKLYGKPDNLNFSIVNIFTGIIF